MKLTKEQRMQIKERLFALCEENIQEATVRASKALNVLDYYWETSVEAPTRKEIAEKYRELCEKVYKDLSEEKTAEGAFITRQSFGGLFVFCIIDSCTCGKCEDGSVLSLEMGIEDSVCDGRDIDDILGEDACHSRKVMN